MRTSQYHNLLVLTDQHKDSNYLHRITCKELRSQVQLLHKQNQHHLSCKYQEGKPLAFLVIISNRILRDRLNSLMTPLNQQFHRIYHSDMGRVYSLQYLQRNNNQVDIASDV